MKKIISYTIFNVFGVLFCRYIWGSPTFDNNLDNIVIIAFLLTFFELILKPVINLLLLPINILTLGLIKVIINTVGLYFVQFLIDNFKISSITSQTIVWEGVTIAPMQFQGFASYVVLSLTLSIFISVVTFFTKSKD